MAFLLDTCAISELGEARPDRKVKEALLALPRDDLHLSTITLGEIQYGIALLPDSSQKSHLISWFNMSVIAVFASRTIPVDTFVALRWGDLFASLRSRGLKMQVRDSLIAATALEYDYTIITRNEADFAPSGVRTFNPWK